MKIEFLTVSLRSFLIIKKLEVSMNALRKSMIVLLFIIGASFSSQIQNVKIQDMNGKEYDLFKLLEEKKHVYVEMIFNQ